MPNQEQLNQSIPGFTADQTWAVKQVIREAVSQGVAEGIKAYQQSNCDDHQARTRTLERVVFGASEEDLVGLDERMRGVEAFEARVNRLTWLVVTQLVTFIFGIILYFAQGGRL